jgi:hypothetical protein
VELRDAAEQPAEIGAGDAEFGPRGEAGVDLLFEGEIGIGLDAAGGAGGGDAAGEVEPWSAIGHLAEEEDTGVAAFGRGVEEVFMHADEAGNDGLAGEIEDLRIGRVRDFERGALDAEDLAIGDVDALIFCRRRASTVDDADVIEDEEVSVFFKEGLESRWS